MSQPLVSVIMPTYNREFCIATTIDSVQNQSYHNWELLIIDDRSTDGTKSLVEAYSKKDTRIKYLRNRYNKGPAGARNYGFDHATGQYIAFLDSDDEFLSHHLKNSIEVLLNEPVNACYSLWYEQKNGQIEKESERIQRFYKFLPQLSLKKRNNVVYFDKQFPEYAILNDLYITHLATVVFKKKLLSKVGKFDEMLLAASDDEFQLRLTTNSKFCLILDYHYIWKWGEDNLSVFNKLDPNKFIFHRKYAIKSRHIMKRHIKSSSCFRSKKGCISALNRSIGQAYFDMGKVLQDHSRVSIINILKSCYFCLKSLCYYNNGRQVRKIVKFLISLKSKLVPSIVHYIL